MTGRIAPQADSCTAQILSHSITSSARLSGVGGTSMFAVSRFITSLNLLGCTTGQFGGLFAHPAGHMLAAMYRADWYRSRQRPPATKLVLDFPQRPATMASRQQRYEEVPTLSIRRGKLARRRQCYCCAGGYRYAVWFVRGLQQLLCEELTLFHAEVATDIGCVGTPTNDR